MSKFKFGDIVRRKDSHEKFIVSRQSKDDGFFIVVPKTGSFFLSIDGDLLELVQNNDMDSRRIEWLFENVISKLDKRIIFGNDISSDNFRERIDALMVDSCLYDK